MTLTVSLLKAKSSKSESVKQFEIKVELEYLRCLIGKIFGPCGIYEYICDFIIPILNCESKCSEEEMNVIFKVILDSVKDKKIEKNLVGKSIEKIKQLYNEYDCFNNIFTNFGDELSVQNCVLLKLGEANDCIATKD